MHAFEARGKLMLTGEYFVLDGAVSLALPTVYGQRLEIETNRSESLHWSSIDKDGLCWLEVELPISLEADEVNDPLVLKLLELLRGAKKMNPVFLSQGARVTITSNFDLQWGLGSSSTLVSLLAQWAQVDPYALQFECFGGSGYDIACATAQGPILYKKKPQPTSKAVVFAPNFKEQLCFVYLGKKQNSREGIRHYRKMGAGSRADVIKTLNELTESVLQETSLEAFSALLQNHEQVVGDALQQRPVQAELFPDFSGVVKSLGAWGGDFVLAVSAMKPSDAVAYFKGKGYPVVVPYSQMVL